MIHDGMHFHKDTPYQVAAQLARFARTETRIRIHYGDTDTGRDWMETHGVAGYVGTSMGPKRVPILIHNKRSHGGPAILTNCIVKMRQTGAILGTMRLPLTYYQHPVYHTPDCWLEYRHCPQGYHWKVMADGSLYAGFKTEAKARRLMAKEFGIDLSDLRHGVGGEYA